MNAKPFRLKSSITAFKTIGDLKKSKKFDIIYMQGKERPLEMKISKKPRQISSCDLAVCEMIAPARARMTPSSKGRRSASQAENVRFESYWRHQGMVVKPN